MTPTELYRSRIKTPAGAALYAWRRLVGRVKRAASGDQRLRCYVGVEIRISEEEFMAWATPEYERFFKEHPGEKPSVDRVRCDGHYEIGNLQIAPHKKNCAKTNRAINVHLPPGHKFCGRCKQVLPFACFKTTGPKETGTFGLKGWCKQCCKEREKQRPPRHPKNE